MNFTPSEKASTFRQPSTANLMIDSDDRAFQDSDILVTSPWRYQITRPNSIVNGFFTRVGLTELVVNWDVPNISSKFKNNILIVDVSGASPNGAQTITLPNGFYTAKKAIDCIVLALNTAYATPSLFSVIQDCSGVGIDVSGARQWRAFMTIPLSEQLFQPDFDANGVPETILDYRKTQYIPSPDLRTVKYLDFVSSKLTYCQDVKDTSTVPLTQDVLQRWYMAWDDQNNLDAYGFPIYQGYTPFSSRKVFNPPKQIKYDTSIPVGNLDFEVFARFSPAFYAVAPLVQGYGSLADIYNVRPESTDSSSWLMSLQLSEN